MRYDLFSFSLKDCFIFNVFLFFNKNRSPIKPGMTKGPLAGSGMTLGNQVGDGWKVIVIDYSRT